MKGSKCRRAGNGTRLFSLRSAPYPLRWVNWLPLLPNLKVEPRNVATATGAGSGDDVTRYHAISLGYQT